MAGSRGTWRGGVKNDDDDDDVQVIYEDAPQSPPSGDQAPQFQQQAAARTRVEGEGSSAVSFSIDREGSHRSVGLPPQERRSPIYFGDLAYEGSPSFSRSQENVSNPRAGRSEVGQPTPHHSNNGHNSGFRHDNRGGIDGEGSRDRPIYVLEGDYMISDGEQRVTGTGEQVLAPSAPTPRKNRNSCFNCDGDHVLGQCPLPKNRQKIEFNRQKFNASKPSFRGGKTKRYHEESAQNDPSLGTPGFLSDHLRTIMELDPSEVPLFAYRMRVYGYPPGWLDNAIKEASSGLKLYGDSITVAPRRKVTQINPSSVFSYPGFNAPMPTGERDRYREYTCPRFREEQSLENMIRDVNLKFKNSSDDGIRSQPAPKPKGFSPASSNRSPASTSTSSTNYFDGTHGLDFPVLNDGAYNGAGRGRRIDTGYLPHNHGPGIGRTRTQSPPLLPRPGRGLPSLSVPTFRALPVENPIVDERYLPRPAEPKRKGRFVGNKGRDSPVVLNLPPVASTSRGTEICVSDDEDETESENASFEGCFGSLLIPLKTNKLVINEEINQSDDDVMIIENNKCGDDSDCLVVESDEEVPSTVVGNQKENRKVPNPFFQTKNGSGKNSVICEDEDDDLQMIEINKEDDPPSSSGSSTGDEDNLQEPRPKKRKKEVATVLKTSQSLLHTFVENWDEEDPNDSSVLSCHSTGSQPEVVEVPSENDGDEVQGEYIPANPKIEAIKDRFLASFSEDQENNEHNEELSRSYSSLPAFDKFAEGMPPMTFEEDIPERTGRLDKLLKTLRARKSENRISDAGSSRQDENSGLK